MPMRKGSSDSTEPAAIASVSVDGTTNWFQELESLTFPPAVSEDGKVIVCTEAFFEGSTSLFCLGAHGTLLWRHDNVADGRPMINDLDGQVLVRSVWDDQWRCAVIAFDIESGEHLWEFTPQGIDPRYSEAYDGPGPLALDANTGTCYALWESWTDNESHLLTAIGPDGAYLWHAEWLEDRQKTYVMPGHPIIDCDGSAYLFYTRTEYDQGTFAGAFCCLDVLDTRGEIIAHNEYQGAANQDFWRQCEPAIGPDKRVYMFAQDFDHPVTCSLYAFGRGSEPPPEYRPAILSAGYGLSRVTEREGGLLMINASVYHPLGDSNIASVDVFIDGAPSGYSLLTAATPGEFNLSVEIAPGMLSPGQFLLELVATDTDGATSNVWPYFTVASTEPGQ